MVYILDINGNPLMPTNRYGKVRRLLNSNKAKVKNNCPFVIQLLYKTTDYVQDITLGIDSGSKHIGVSAIGNNKVLYEGDIELRNDIVNLLAERKANRVSRRHRKTRYRKPRFNNRRKDKKWLAPSISHKINTHLRVVKDLHKILPINKMIVEVAAFDIQKLKNPNIMNLEYQIGEQYSFNNVREYVLWRDNHMCQCCKGKTKDKILNVHHIESRKFGGNAPDNLITLCKTCHLGYHNGIVELPKNIKRGQSFRDATFMSIMRWNFYNKLKELYPNVSMTYGYITKDVRIKNQLPKEHYIDARCIAGYPNAVSENIVYYQKKIRCHNRQIHKYTINKGGERKMNQAPYIIRGYRLYDVVLAKGKKWYIHGRRTKGSFILKDLNNNSLEITPTKIKLLYHQRSFLTERRCTDNI